MKICIIFLLVWTSSALAENWETISQKHMGSPSGKKYELEAAQFAASSLGSIMGICLNSVPPAEFALYFKILANGSISESSSSNSLPVTACFSKKLSALHWPKPPFSPFVFKLNMFGNPDEF